MKTKTRVLIFVVVMIFATVCALSVPAFELIPQRYGLISLVGFIVLYGVFLKDFLTNNDEPR